MNTEFSINRVKNLLIRQYTNYKKQYFYGIAIIISIITLQTGISGDLTLYAIKFEFPLIWLLFTGILAFTDYNEKHQRTFQINLPASRFEKYLTEIISNFIIVPIISLISICIAVFIGMLLAKLFYATPFSFDSKIEYFNYDLNSILSFLQILVVLFFGAIYFKKYKIIKIISIWVSYWTVLALLLFVIVISRLQLQGSGMLINHYIHNLPEGVYIIFSIVWIVFFLWLTYQRLKEERA